jgi:hypothetical protein
MVIHDHHIFMDTDCMGANTLPPRLFIAELPVMTAKELSERRFGAEVCLITMSQ